MQHRIIELLTRKMAGEATDSELNELNELMYRYPDSLYYEEFLKQLWVSATEETDFDKVYQQHKLKFSEELEFKEEEDEIKSYGFNKYKKPFLVFCFIIVV